MAVFYKSQVRQIPQSKKCVVPTALLHTSTFIFYQYVAPLGLYPGLWHTNRNIEFCLPQTLKLLEEIIVLDPERAANVRQRIDEKLTAIKTDTAFTIAFW